MPGWGVRARSASAPFRSPGLEPRGPLHGARCRGGGLRQKAKAAVRARPAARRTGRCRGSGHRCAAAGQPRLTDPSRRRSWSPAAQPTGTRPAHRTRPAAGHGRASRQRCGPRAAGARSTGEAGGPAGTTAAFMPAPCPPDTCPPDTRPCLPRLPREMRSRGALVPEQILPGHEESAIGDVDRDEQGARMPAPRPTSRSPRRASDACGYGTGDAVPQQRASQLRRRTAAATIDRVERGASQAHPGVRRCRHFLVSPRSDKSLITHRT